MANELFRVIELDNDVTLTISVNKDGGVSRNFHGESWAYTVESSVDSFYQEREAIDEMFKECLDI